MGRSCNLYRSHWQQGILVIVVTLAIRLSSGSLNCTGEPCMYGICMNNTNSSYSCYCIDGYTGINCEINWDDCWSDPCLNGGTCNDAVASYNCTCPDGFIGLNCEQKYSECLNQPCLNNGTCIDYNGFMCQCPEGYSGDYCEIDASVCNNTICKNSGECIEGPGFSFYCRCAEGWTGGFCEEDVDECVASPCQNGGLCLNLPATYTCACLFGFTGKDCDKAIVPCATNPCENEAMCLLEDSQPICYCVPDYHGQLCELRYNDCESKFARCENGGTCIDGINNFTCSCPSNYSGEMCHVYNSTIGTISTPIDDFTTVSLPTMIYLTSGETTSTSFSSTSQEGISTRSDSTLNQENASPETVTINPNMRNISIIDNRSDIPNISSTTPINFDSSTSRIHSTTSTDGKSPRFDETTQENDFLTSTIFDDFTTVDSTIPSTRIDDFTTGSSIGSEESSSSDATIFQETGKTSVEFSTSPTILSTSPLSMKTTLEEKTTSREILESEISTIFTSTEKIDWTEAQTSRTTATNFDVESRGFSDGEIEATTMETFSSTSENPIWLVPDATKIVQISSSPRDEESIFRTTEATRYNCSEEECERKNCSNVSTKCDCDSAKKCSPGIENAAFNGKSYVRQQINVNGDGSLRIFIRLKTKSKSGIIVHAFFDDERYVLLYMEGGQLKFQFSCGLQTMLLGEIDSPINNGFDVDVEMRFQYLIGTDDIGKCSARLLVNDTMAMSGEQILSSHDNIPRKVRVHLGGIPQAFSHYFPRIAMGFIGCMSLLRINNIPRHFIRDSVETFQIEECTSFLCLLNPCRNFGSCHDIDGQIYCKCIAGYSGALCERSACEDNPCFLGATCISSPGTGFICVCPLGMHGLLCDEESAIVQPSFSVFIPGFSSYVAYGLKNAIKDEMELRMRLVPHSMDQISLIAFMGQSGTNRDVSDHFSLTYVRGYIMLTWDLGSGVRRIFTKSPLRTRAHRAHTLRAGRRGREAWLSVDELGNVTGQAAGTMTQLNVSPILYVGGHKSRNFDALPHDLPLHTGFAGCIYDIELLTDDTIFPITRSSPASGRGVGECRRNECLQNTCKNGALCLNHGPTYSCICMKEWEGADCSVPAVTCSSSSPYKCQRVDLQL